MSCDLVPAQADQPGSTPSEEGVLHSPPTASGLRLCACSPSSRRIRLFGSYVWDQDRFGRKPTKRRNSCRFRAVTEWPGFYRSLDTRPVSNTLSAHRILHRLEAPSLALHPIDPNGCQWNGNKSRNFYKYPYGPDIWALFKLFQVRHPLPSKLPFGGTHVISCLYPLF